MRSVTASRKTFARRGSVACAGALAVAAAGSVSARTSPPQAKLIKGPYLTGLAEGGVDVRFELDAPAVASVELAADGTIADVRIALGGERFLRGRQAGNADVVCFALGRKL